MASLFLQSSSNSLLTMSLIHIQSISIFPPSYIFLAFPKNWNELSLTGFMHIIQGGRSHAHNLLFCHYCGCITCISAAFPSHCDLYRNEYFIYLCIYLLLILYNFLSLSPSKDLLGITSPFGLPKRGLICREASVTNFQQVLMSIDRCQSQDDLKHETIRPKP